MMYLTGFMGCGKTSAGKILARRLGLPFTDTDRWIQTQTGLTIPELFARCGEEHFRALETQALMAAPDGIVATGGGAVLRAENRALMKKRGTVVFIDVPFETIEKRLGRASGRPLFDRDARVRYESRRPLYKTADITVLGGDSPAQTAENILLKLGAL